MVAAAAVAVAAAAGEGVAATEAVGEVVAAGGGAQAADTRKFWQGRRRMAVATGGRRSYASRRLWRRRGAGSLAAVRGWGLDHENQGQPRCVDRCGRFVSRTCALA